MAHNDFKQKEPSKNEKMLLELAMHQQSIERNLWSTSAFASALGLILNADPGKIAELLVNGDDRIKEYSGKINQAIEKLDKEKKAKEATSEKN